MKNSIMKKYVLTGLLALLPIFFTIYIIRILFVVVNNLLLWIPLSPTNIWIIDLFFKLIMVFFIIIIVGYLVSNLITKKYFLLAERMLEKIPLIKSLYGASKHFIEALFLKNRESFSEVVLMQYPRKGIYTLGLVTKSNPCENLKNIAPESEKKRFSNANLVSVFVPTTPIPTSGLLVMVPRKDLITLDIPIEEGIKMIVSGGVLEAKKRKKL